jgi:hypothetical protein
VFLLRMLAVKNSAKRQDAFSPAAAITAGTVRQAKDLAGTRV